MADTNQLYPVFDVPFADAIESQDAEQEFKPAPLFDYDKGDFVRDGANRVVMVDGREAFKNWVLKTISTQRGSCLAYPDIGIDYEGALLAPTHEAVQSALERTISEALLSDPHTDRVYDFEFKWQADSITVSFTVQPKSWAAFNIEQTIV